MSFISITIETPNELNNFEKRIYDLVKHAESTLINYFNSESLYINLLIKKDTCIIPEMGIGGFAPNKNNIEITIDPTNTFLQRNFKNTFLTTLYHEAHHCYRHATAGYGDTLFKAMISEGLACCFEVEAGYAIPLYVNHLPTLQRRKLLKRAQKIWHEKPYNHNDWFFGNPNDGIPRWTAYDLGYSLVKLYLNTSKQTAGANHNTDSDQILSVLNDILLNN